MAKSNLTEWNMPRVLLETVPEAAPQIALAAVKAYDIDMVQLKIPVPPSTEQFRQMTLVEREAHPREKALNDNIGADLRVAFGSYPVSAWMFLPVLESALDSDPLDEDLVRRCCRFLEMALAGEEFVAEGITMMVAENFGAEHTALILPFAGPLFREALRSCNWIDDDGGVGLGGPNPPRPGSAGSFGEEAT